MNTKPNLSDKADELSVRYAYLYLLGREPENPEVVKGWLDANISNEELRRTIMNSDEYKDKFISIRRNPYADLNLNGESKKRSVLLLGTCVAEGLAITGLDLGWNIKHYLYESGLYDTVPVINDEDWSFDCVLVHLTLRTILTQANKIINSLYDGDLFYLRSIDLDELYSVCRDIIEEILGNIYNVYGGKKPVFFISFLESKRTSSGLLSSSNDQSFYRISVSLNDILRQLISERDGFYYLEINDISEAIGDFDFYDGYKRAFAHAGIDGKGVNIFRENILRRLDILLNIINDEEEKIKLIITDLDGTLWKGVLAEEEEITCEQTDGWPLGYAEALLECKRRGILLAICSKNEYEITKKNFELAWGDRLKIEDFCSVKINWKPKSENIKDILSEVNVLPSNVLFVDDNPLEIEEVKRVYPEIRVLTGDQQKWRMELLYSAPLQVKSITDESKRKTELIRAKVERSEMERVMDRQSYLKSLSIKMNIIEVRSASHPRFPRALELLNKTNQFNTTGARWSEGDLSRIIDAGGVLYCGIVEDRLANHGLVTVAIVIDNELVQMVLSCRVFGLGIEHALLRYIAEGKGWLDDKIRANIRFENTGRNATAEKFINEICSCQDNSDHMLDRIPDWPIWISQKIE